MKKTTEITCLFVDVGGVLLTDGWDHDARSRAAKKFKLEWAEMEDRHRLNFSIYEEGKLTLEEYMSRVIFHQKRSFNHDWSFLAPLGCEKVGVVHSMYPIPPGFTNPYSKLPKARKLAVGLRWGIQRSFHCHSSATALQTPAETAQSAPITAATDMIGQTIKTTARVTIARLMLPSFQ